MQHVANETPQKPSRQVRFPGICTHAAKLGVHRNHLRLVLLGKRSSKKLMRAYRALKGAK
jgi:hypothetical protein